MCRFPSQSKFRQSFLLSSFRVGLKWEHQGPLTNGSFWFCPLAMSLRKMWHTVSHIRGEMVAHRASGKLSAEDLKEQQVREESIEGSSDQCLEFMQNSAYAVIFSAISVQYLYLYDPLVSWGNTKLNVLYSTVIQLKHFHSEPQSTHLFISSHHQRNIWH